MARTDAFSTARELTVGNHSYRYYSLEAFEAQGNDISRLPFSIKVLLEAALRQFDGRAITKDHVNQIANFRSRCCLKQPCANSTAAPLRRIT